MGRGRLALLVLGSMSLAIVATGALSVAGRTLIYVCPSDLPAGRSRS